MEKTNNICTDEWEIDLNVKEENIITVDFDKDDRQ